MEIDKKREQGRKNRASGAYFEMKVRKHLEGDGWIVCKWVNNVKDGVCVPAMSRFNSRNNGFPDFLAYQPFQDRVAPMCFVEVKSNGYLSKEEKEKARWYLKNRYCKQFFIASKDKEKRGGIKFTSFF